ncbi:MAG: polysialyltransferase family glycosyltransferase [Propionibacteriaceae bacterium]
MTTQVFVASTAFGLATVVAALDDGAFAPADRRILLLSNNAATPETANRIEDVAGLRGLFGRFDDVYDYNDVIAPQHPSLWRPRAADLPILQRHFAALWGLDDDVHLVVESIQVSPAVTLCRIFPDARIDVYADGLMSYGPTRSKLPALVASRVERLLHLDLAPGLTPVLLTEFGVPATVISTDAFRKTIASLDPPPPVIAGQPPGQVAVLLGQYLAAAGLLTLEEETELHLEMVRGAVAAGFGSLIFKPHPTAPPMLAEPLVAEAARLGASLTVYDGPELVETWFRSESIGCVIGCFSTALMTAATCYDLPVARVGTELLLDRLRPFQNSNRIPVTIIHATLPHVTELSASAGDHRADTRSPDELARIVRAVSYCMQPQRYPDLRASAEQLLSERGEVEWHYFKRRRLTVLDLPGRLPERTPRRLLVPRPVRVVVKRALGPSMSAQVSRISQRLIAPGASRTG